MAKITLSNLSSGYQSTAELNANLQALEDELNDKVLYRDCPTGETNTMQNDLDMNSNRIRNLPSPGHSNDPARWVDLTDSLDLSSSAVPALTGNANKFLMTDGATMSWSEIGAASIGENAITTVELADDAVETANIKNLNVTTGKLAEGAVTYAKIQDCSATKRVLGRNTAGSGDFEEVTATQVVDWLGTPAQGDILYRNASAWVYLPAGTSGQYLKTQGAGANPTWATIPANATTSASATGATVDFTGLPSGIRDISVCFAGVSLDTTSRNVAVRLGYGSTTWISAGYIGSRDGASLSDEIDLTPAIADTRSINGILTLSKVSSNLWAFKSAVGLDNGAMYTAAGYVDVTATLTGVRCLIGGSGSGSFDAGTIAVNYYV